MEDRHAAERAKTLGFILLLPADSYGRGSANPTPYAPKPEPSCHLEPLADHPTRPVHAELMRKASEHFASGRIGEVLWPAPDRARTLRRRHCSTFLRLRPAKPAKAQPLSRCPPLEHRRWHAKKAPTAIRSTQVPRRRHRHPAAAPEYVQRWCSRVCQTVRGSSQETPDRSEPRLPLPLFCDSAGYKARPWHRIR